MNRDSVVVGIVARFVGTNALLKRVFFICMRFIILVSVVALIFLYRNKEHYV